MCYIHLTITCYLFVGWLSPPRCLGLWAQNFQWLMGVSLRTVLGEFGRDRSKILLSELFFFLQNFLLGGGGGGGGSILHTKLHYEYHKQHYYLVQIWIIFLGGFISMSVV